MAWGIERMPISCPRKLQDWILMKDETWNIRKNLHGIKPQNPCEYIGMTGKNEKWEVRNRI